VTARLLAAVIALGAAWAAIAAAVHLALFRGLIPSYDQLAFPFAVALALLDLPLLVGLYIETAIGRGSITYAEVIVVSVVSGVLLSLALAALVLRMRGALAGAR
jgi:hypothetical protein